MCPYLDALNTDTKDVRHWTEWISIRKSLILDPFQCGSCRCVSLFQWLNLARQKDDHALLSKETCKPLSEQLLLQLRVFTVSEKGSTTERHHKYSWLTFPWSVSYWKHEWAKAFLNHYLSISLRSLWFSSKISRFLKTGSCCLVMPPSVMWVNAWPANSIKKLWWEVVKDVCVGDTPEIFLLSLGWGSPQLQCSSHIHTEEHEGLLVKHFNQLAS